MLQLFGIFLPQYHENFFFFNDSRVTADLVVDSLQYLWPILNRRYQTVTRLVINLDNGPEVNSRRTWFIKRMVEFVYANAVPVSLAYYPPYHSKYNPIERVWGVLENYWGGELLNSRDKVYDLAAQMKWNGRHPQVVILPGTYSKGKRLTPKQMREYETRLSRHDELGPWFVHIEPAA